MTQTDQEIIEGLAEIFSESKKVYVVRKGGYLGIDEETHPCSIQVEFRQDVIPTNIIIVETQIKQTDINQANKFLDGFEYSHTSILNYDVMNDLDYTSIRVNFKRTKGVHIIRMEKKNE